MKVNWKGWLLFAVLGGGSAIIGHNLNANIGPVWLRMLLSAAAGIVVILVLSGIVYLVKRPK